MSAEMEQRIAKLEQEVMDLRREVHALKQQRQTEQLPSSISSKSIIVGTAIPHELKKKHEQAIEKVVTPKRSLEELIMWALPKVFMVILVLGVLWGLKLVSDYGYLSNEVKIILAYLLSVALAGTAYILENKKRSSPAITISLYGGAFIVGILTTAAGAILYELLGLYVALLIALMYIGYGIIISFFKKNEVLTIFVAFTSLLIPYLLEYMEFSPVIILGFIIVLFGSLQTVIISHQQKVALYVATIFSVFAINILALLNGENMTVFALSLLGVLALFIMSWSRMVMVEPKARRIHAGLLFSLSSMSLLFFNGIILSLEHRAYLLLIMLGLYLGLAYFGRRHERQEVFDVACTIAMLTFFNILLVLNLTSEAARLLLPLSAFVSVMMALRLRARFMMIVQAFIFSITVMLSILVNEPMPFFSIEHVSLVLPLVYLLIIAVYMKRPKELDDSFEELMKKLYVLDCLPVFICAYFLGYFYKVDVAYFGQLSKTPHVMAIALAVVFAVSLMTPQTTIGRFLSPLLGGSFVLLSLSITMAPDDIEGIEFLAITTRLVYVGVIVGILFDLVRNGRIAQNHQKLVEKVTEQVMSAGIVLAILIHWGLLNLLAYNDLLDWTYYIAFTTIALFIAAGIALWLSSKRTWRTVRLTGFVLLAIAIMKLIFFDLSSLDLLIRAVLFMTIGALGLVLSNRLLK